MKYIVREKKALPKSEYLLVIEIPAEDVAHEESHVLSGMKKNLELPGFRKGFVPEKIIRERMGALALFEEAASDALARALAEVFRAEKLDVIGRPRVEATKLAPGNPAEFKVTLSLYPKLELPDYKRIASAENTKKAESADVEEREIDTVIAEIKKQHEATAGKKDSAITDESVKEFGEFNNISDFRTKVKEGLTAHKAERDREKRRAELLDKITEKTKGEIPDVLVESELARMEHELRLQIERLPVRGTQTGMGAKFDDYLKEINKDRETLRKEWRKDAEKRARLQLMLAEIARTEKLVVSDEEVGIEVKHIFEHHKGADPDSVRSYVETLLINQKVLAFLEDQK